MRLREEQAREIAIALAGAAAHSPEIIPAT
jgi:phosphoribosylcarboxyaminoimidazole (NCAIR) mutase